MMTRNIRKVVSIVCAVAILMSLCVVSMVNTTSAFKASDTPVGGELKLDFEDKTGISDGTYFAYDKATNSYVADPADPNNTVVNIFSNTQAGVNVEIGNEGCTTLDGSDAYSLKPNTKYVISFKYKFAKGSYCSQDSMRIVLYSGVQSEYSPSVSKTAIKDAVYNVDAAANPETITVGPISAGGANQTVHVLAEDTEWMTFTTVYTTDAVVAKDNLYIVAANNPQFMPYGKLSVYVDDFYLDIVDEIDTHQVFNFKKDSDNTYWNPKNHNLFANSDDSKGNLSYVDAAGAHFTVKHSSVANTNATWRQKIYAYDYDCGGFFQIKSGYTFVVTLKYKVEALGSKNAFIGIGHTQKGSDNTNPYGNPTLHIQKRLLLLLVMIVPSMLSTTTPILVSTMAV